MDFDFRFKKFGIFHSESTMKVGTDAILLGALVNFDENTNVLEIGTGCGIISLMIAQRFSCHITAIEIDHKSALQAKQNVASSPWNKNINVIHNDVKNHDFKHKFDVIVSNPPYFQSGLLSKNNQKSTARHAHSLNFKELLEVSQKLLTENGCLWLVLPILSYEIFESESKSQGFYCNQKFYIKNSQKQDVSLIVTKWVKHETKTHVRDLVIRNNDETYSEDYIQLTNSFHPFL
jgi:tRNA1Val (adenine37-N6)-methyltransferase